MIFGGAIYLWSSLSWDLTQHYLSGCNVDQMSYDATTHETKWGVRADTQHQMPTEAAQVQGPAALPQSLQQRLETSREVSDFSQAMWPIAICCEKCQISQTDEARWQSISSSLVTDGRLCNHTSLPPSLPQTQTHTLTTVSNTQTSKVHFTIQNIYQRVPPCPDRAGECHHSCRGNKRYWCL